MSAPTETQADVLQLPHLLLRSPAFVMLQLLRHGKRRAEASPHGPRLPQLMVLACLDEFGPQSQRDLCRRLGFDPSDMVGFIDRLESQGLAARERDPVDRRRHAIVMTELGRTWLRQSADDMTERSTHLLAGLSADERMVLIDLLRRALAGLDERVPDQYRSARSASDPDGNLAST